MRSRLRSPLAVLAALAAATTLLGAPSPAAATVETAPGRVVFPLANGRASLSSAVPLPGGGALLAGAVEHSGRVYLAKLSGTGAVDPSFGSGGVATVDAELALEQMLVRPDGRILLVGIHSRIGNFTEELRWNEPHGSMVVIELNSDGSIERDYGTDGTARSTLEPGCYCHTTALEQEGGGLVLTGRQEFTTHKYGGRQETHTWTLARLTTSGVLDQGFGHGGIATVPGKEGVGLSLAQSQNGTIVAQGQLLLTTKTSEGPENVMTRLLPTGAPDLSYAGGTPFKLPVFTLDDSYGQVPEPLESTVEPDGRVVIETIVPPNPGRPKDDIGVGLVAYNATGQPDSTFGYDGHLDLEEGEASGSLLLPLTGGDILAVHRPVKRNRQEERRWVPGMIAFERVSPAGLLDDSFAMPPGLAVEIPFGGGIGDPSPLLRGITYPEADSSLDQDTFLGPNTEPLLVPEQDGSLLLAGNVTLTVPEAPRVPGRGTGRIAVAALTPSLTLNTDAGGPAPPPTLTLTAPGQSLRGDVLHRRILIAAQASAPGLAEIEVFSGRRLLARKLAALLDSTRTRVPVPLSAPARRYLRAHPHAHLHVSATLRDLLANVAAATSSFSLRQGATSARHR